MAHVENVIGALFPFWETADPPHLAEGGEAFLPAGDDLMGIGLVSHVPDQKVPWRIEHIVEGQGQLHRSQGRGQVAAPYRHGFNHHLPELFGQAVELVQTEMTNVLGKTDPLQDILVMSLASVSHRC